MKGFEQSERNLDWSRTNIFQLRPSLLVVRFDRRLIFGQRQLVTDIAVHVAFRYMMNNLSNRPATGAVRCVELLPGQPLHRQAQPFGRYSNVIDVLPTLFRTVDAAVPGKRTYRKTQIHQISPRTEIMDAKGREKGTGRNC